MNIQHYLFRTGPHITSPGTDRVQRHVEAELTPCKLLLGCRSGASKPKDA